MAHLLLTPGESLLMRAALKSRLTELGRPGDHPEDEVGEVEAITRLLRQMVHTPAAADALELQASAVDTELMARSLSRAASWQRSLLPQARQQGVLASLCRKVEGVADHPSLPQRVARHVTHLLHRDLA